MKVVAVEAIPVAYPEANDDGHLRHLLLVRLRTDAGADGWGEAVTLWPESTAATALLIEGLAPLVVGTAIADREATVAALQTHTWWYGNGGLTAFAIAALDIALWDLAGKAENLPLVELLGGAVHTALPVLLSCHAMDSDLERMAEEMAGWVRDRQAAGIKVGLGKRGSAGLGLDADRDERFVAALRAALGPKAKIMIDVGSRVQWDLRTALDRCRMLETYDVDWVEEPLGADDPEGYAELRRSTTVRIAYGEREWTPRGIERISKSGTVDVVGIDPGRCEGITGWRRAQRHVAAAGAEVNAHAFSGAIVTAASLALSLSAANCRQIEVKPLADPAQTDFVTTPVRSTDGRLTALSGPGLGVEVDEDVVRSYSAR